MFQQEPSNSEIKSSWFVSTGTCSLHPTSTTPSSREIMLVGDVGPDFLFMDDNVQPHRSSEVADTLQSENILHMQWPVFSPDLDPIEHFWDALGRRVAQKTIPLCTVQELKTVLREEWHNIPQGLLDSLVKDMENRCKICIRISGQHTSY
ncbi:transposable element Tcb2 transposase [Trichonephila clavipes]|nr:transposable element Tcb2 transposase [Trichonephila clavipes]